MEVSEYLSQGTTLQTECRVESKSAVVHRTDGHMGGMEPHINRDGTSAGGWNRSLVLRDREHGVENGLPGSLQTAALFAAPSKCGGV